MGSYLLLITAVPHELCANFADILLYHIAVAFRDITPYRLMDTLFAKDLIRIRGQENICQGEFHPKDELPR